MKKSLLILLCVPLIGFGQLTYVPDNAFESYLEANGMGNGFTDNYVTTSNISSVLSLDVGYQNISDLTGIEDFISLTNLDCEVNQITSLDISNNINLVDLNCRYNQLSNLDLSSNTSLVNVNCRNNQMISLNLNNVDSLESLFCWDNQLTSLNVNNCSSLLGLRCENNYLTSLDVSNNTLLYTLTCYNNQLTSLNVDNNTSLMTIYCQDNQLTSLDLSNHIYLASINCSNNQLTTLDLTNTSFNNNYLYQLYCINNQLTSLNVSNNTSMENLSCSNNQLSNLDITNCVSLKYLICDTNQLTSLDVTNFSALFSFDCSTNQITSLDLSTNPNLKYFKSMNNQLISLDLRNGNNNYLSNVNVLGNPYLYCIDVDNPSSFVWSNWFGLDPQTTVSLNCPTPLLGCMDSLACNFDISANINDNSCVYPSTSVDSIGTFCDSYTWIDGITYTANDNTATYTLTNSSGCDSIITLDLIINYSTTLIENQVVCDFYTWPINGSVYSSSIIDTFFTTNPGGCTEINILDLTVNYSTTNTSIVTVCNSYTWIDGVNYMVSNNTANYITTNASGCDNIATLNLTITGNPISSIIQNGANLEVTIVDTYIWNTGEITQIITPTTNGWYWCIVTDANGCIGDTTFYEVTNIVSAITETINTKKTLLRVTNILGQETPYRRNTPLFYLYNDGTVEKKIIIE
tara:strand:- start:78 stop:2141 length:2064 start_codon:yes stop_codon:yes gene_type:complete